MWDLSCRDWEERLRTGRSLVPDLPLNRREADRAVAVFKMLRVPDVPGQPTFAEACGPWFIDIVAALFGSVIDGVRMIRELELVVPKKNSKSTNGAGLMLTASLLSMRPRAEFLIIGPTQKIADNAYNQAEGMVLADPELVERVHVQRHIKKLTVKATGVTLQVKTFDQNVLTGTKVSGGALIEEIHELAKIAKAEAVMRQIAGGMLPYPEAFLAMITTQSEDPPAGVFLQELTKARAIRDGLAQGRMLPVLYEFPEAMQRDERWRDPAIWSWVNPNMGRSLQLSDLIEAYNEAKAKGEGPLKAWSSQHLNIEIGIGLKTGRWEGVDHWEKNANEAVKSLDELMARCDCIVFGADGGGLDDLFGLVALGRDRDTRKWLAWAHAWAYRGERAEDGEYYGGLLERRKEIVPRLVDFAAEGTLTWFDEPGEDVAAIVELIMKVEDAGLLAIKGAIGVDVVGIAEVVDELEKRGITVESGRVVGIGQGWMLTTVIKTTARLLAAKKLIHGGTKLMNWCVSNAKLEPRGNAVTITKQAAGTAKIDPLMALFNAVTLMARNPEAQGSSIYDTLAREEAEAAARSETQPAPANRDPIDAYAKARENYARRFLAGDDD